jgi:exopolyphosphatase / guanosine-5'-triphosphate,3'-diphosphate pyrophosphatase
MTNRGQTTAREAARDRRRRGVLQVAHELNWNHGHAEQVAGLAVDLFQQIPLQARWEGPADEWLEYAAFMHDIGYTVNTARHHRHSEKLILAADLPGIVPMERHIVALVARFHRKKKPDPGMKAFTGRPRHVYETVRSLSAILRIADGLDRTHQSLAEGVTVTRTMQGLDIAVRLRGRADTEIRYARRKSSLLESVLKTPVLIRPA